MARQIRYGDMTIAVPDDASDAEVQSIIETKEVESKAKPFKPGPLEAAGRSLAGYGQSIKDAATAPGGGPTGLNLVDAAAGVADFGASMATDVATAVPRIASHVFAGARGSKKPYSERVEEFTRKPTTPVGNAIQNTVGAALAPVGAAISATGASPDAAALGLDVAGTALDVVGLGAAARGAKAGVRGARTAAGAPDLPTPTPDGTPLRPFGASVEKARRLDYRVLPSQVAGRAQAAAPAGEFGFGHKVPGTFREGFTANDLTPMAIIDNQKRTNSFAAKELGISEITPQGLALAKNPHNAVFNEVARSVPAISPDDALTQALNALGEARRSNPLLKNSNDVELLRERLLAAGPVPTQKVLDAIREYRRDASTLYKKLGDPEAEQQAAAYRAAADALEGAIERQAGVLDPSLVPRLKDARTALAKIHNVEDSLDGSNVDATRLARIGDKYPLTGYLADIAEIAREFPDTMKSATGVPLPSQSNIGSIWSPNLFARRGLGKEQGPALLRDNFQRKFGAADTTYDPRQGPTPVEGSPFAEYTPPAGDVPGGADVMPPAPGGGPGLTATDLAADFDQLPPTGNRMGDPDAPIDIPLDMTAETPPMGGSDIPQGTTGSRDEFAAYPPRVPPAGDDLAADFVQDADFIAGRSGVQDPGLDFAPDPDMASASIVRGGGEPGTVQDTLDLVEDLLGVDLRGRPLDPETGAGMSGPDVREPYTRPAPGLGDDLGTGFGEPPADPLLGFDPVREGEFEPGVGPFQRGPRGGDDIVDAEVTDSTVRRGQRKLPPPGDEDLGAAMVEPEGPPPQEPAPMAFDEYVKGIPPRRSIEEIMADEALEENTIAAREARDAGAAGPRNLADDFELSVEETPTRELPTDFNAIEETLSEGAIKLGDDTRSIVIKPFGDRMRIQQTDVRADMRGQGLNRQNIKDALDAAQKQGMPLDSDQSFTRDAWNSWKSALDKGIFTGELDRAAIEAAMEAGGGVARNPSGEPWIRNIQLGPAG